MKRNNLLLLALIVLSAAVFVNAQSVPAGSDYWVTNSNSTFDTLNLPAGFFGAGSKAYSGTVYFTGDPASGNEYDTKINRTKDVDLSSGSGTTPLVVADLRLKSVSPITVTYDDGHSEQWDVYVTLSSAQGSTGSMTISGGRDGGSFNSSLDIVPKFNFVRATGFGELSEKGRTVVVLDLGSPSIQQYLKGQARLAGERISKGKATPADEAAAAACQATPKTDTPTTQNAAAPVVCSVKLSSTTQWKFDNGRFIPFPTTEQGRLAAHGIFPYFPRF